MQLSNAIASAISQKSFELILLPTEQCNFRCFYCYEDFKLKTMKRSTIDAVKNFITRRGDLDHFSISWFGGEPMLAMPVIEEISDHVKSLVDRGQFKKFQSAITTNGFFLTNDNLDTLYKSGVKKFQITLDGDTETHDSLRKDSKGRGTFYTIWAHLENIKRRTDLFDVEVYLRLHYQPSTVSRIKAFVPEIDSAFLDDSRFKLLFHSVEPLGGPNDQILKQMSRVEKSQLEAEFQELMSHGRQLAKSFIQSDGAYICYAAKVNSLIIRSNGSLAKCTVAFSDTRNSVGTLVADGSLIVDGKKMSGWIDSLKSKDLKQLACPYSFMKKASIS